MKQNHKKYTFEVNIPIMDAFKHCCEMYGVTQQDMINDVLLKFVMTTEEEIEKAIQKLNEEERQPKLFSFLNSTKNA